MSPTLSFSSAALVVLESATRLISLSFALTVNVPAFASTDVTSPVTPLVLTFSDFSNAGAAGVAGVAGVAGFACAKLTPLKAKLVKAITSSFVRLPFFVASEPKLGRIVT